jgi:hypothetical protein
MEPLKQDLVEHFSRRREFLDGTKRRNTSAADIDYLSTRGVAVQFHGGYMYGNPG